MGSRARFPTSVGHDDPDFGYELAILTHGRAATLPAALAAAREHLRPLPSRIRLFGDGVEDLAAIVGAVRGVFPDVEDPAVSATHPSRQQGFCGATRRLWQAAAERSDYPYVFWLEHDFLLERPILVEQLAGLLEQEPDLAQVALVRNAVNEQEVAAGGLVQSRPGAFAPRDSIVGVWRVRWLEHREFFTTNPSLMRRDFMAANPWPGYDAECEGKFGIDLVAAGYRFAFWGDGIPWTRHVGVRDGFGY